MQRGQETFVITPGKLFFPTELAQRECTCTCPPSLTFQFKGTADLPRLRIISWVLLVMLYPSDCFYVSLWLLVETNQEDLPPPAEAS